MIYKNFIESSLREASKIASSYFGKVSGITKEGDNNQVLTQADLEVGRFLVDKIRSEYPTYNIIDEEAGVVDNKSNMTWVVDPIDGTSNFSNGIPFCGIMMGLLQNDLPIAGGIALPILGEIYIAEKGFGAYKDNQKIHVTQEENLLHVLVAYQIDGHQENPEQTRNETRTLANIILGIRNLRAFETCYDAALLSQGKIGAYLNNTSKIWDNVAPQIIIEESGGIYTDFKGKSMDYSNALQMSKANFTVCAAAPQLHGQLQEIIHKSTI